ncbi:hypothetical protein EMIT0P100_230058 [Pseudomonas sp. IT-P100]
MAGSKHDKTLWRGSLLPLGCEAAPKKPAALKDRSNLFYDCCAVEREQAPSPQGGPCDSRIF